MTRFVRIIPTSTEPGERLRLEHSSALGTILADESVHPEQVDNPDARHYETHDMIELNLPLLRWLHRVSGELLATIDGIPQHSPEPVEDAVLAPMPDIHDDETLGSGERDE